MNDIKNYSVMRLLFEKQEEDNRIYDELCLKQEKEQEENRRYLESKRFNEESLKCNILALQKADISNKVAKSSFIISVLSLFVAIISIFITLYIKK